MGDLYFQCDNANLLDESLIDFVRYNNFMNGKR